MQAMTYGFHYDIAANLIYVQMRDSAIGINLPPEWSNFQSNATSRMT